MASVRNLYRSFSGGEVSPEFAGRIDDVKYQSGLEICRNFICTPLGPIKNRGGLGFVAKVKNNDPIALVPFVSHEFISVMIEMGAGYFRFYSKGAPILNLDKSVYEISNIYAQDDLAYIHFVQSNDVITFTHWKYPPYELRRYAMRDWRFVKSNFGSLIDPPSGLVLSSVGSGKGETTYWYTVTAVTDEDASESNKCVPASIKSDLTSPGFYVKIQWQPVPNASTYRVYRQVAGVYGFIGETDGTSIIDDGSVPDTSRTPCINEDPFTGEGNYPSTVSYFEQRKCFAASASRPSTVWMTRSSTESDMGFSIPAKDDDRLKFSLSARELNVIRHIIPLNKLVILTSTAEWSIESGQTGVLTPSTIHARPQSYCGASSVPPVMVNNSIIYCSARGGNIREMGYSAQSNGFITGDISLRASHLFDNAEVIDMTYTKSPYPIVWAVNNRGALLGLTYIPEHQIGAWHRHDTDGEFEACKSIPEDSEDALYVVVKRKINGQFVRYIEQLKSRAVDALKDSFFVDSGKSYGTDMGPHVMATTFSGLDHLEGKTVAILGDGAVFPQQVVRDGMVNIDHPVATAHIGLPIVAEMKTLPLAVEIDNAFAQGKVKNVNKAWVKVYRSSGIFVGPSVERMTDFKQRTTEPLGSPPSLKSEEIPLAISPSWASGGQIIVRQQSPLPLTIVSITTEVEVGG